MRLTLRTLLAYIDGILPPEDAEDIGKRIEESEQATALMHRVRDVMRRLRLAAPGLSVGGSGLDCNTVAEYLDNTLPSNRVADFEKLCLDSDVHLAELAACHQILAMVLGEAAEIDPATRDRMYALPNREDAIQEDTVEGAVVDGTILGGVVQGAPSPDGADAEESAAAAADRPPVQKRRQKPVVPDYLRESRNRSRLVPVAVAIGLTLCLALIVLGATGQFKSGSALDRTIARMTGADRTESNPPGQSDDSQPSSDTTPSDTQPESPNPDNPPELGGDSLPLPVEPPVEPDGSEPNNTDGEPDLDPGGDSVAGPFGPFDTPPIDDPEVGLTLPEDTEPIDLGPADVEPVVTEPVDVVAPPEPPVGLAGLMSERQVVLRYDPDDMIWQRVPQQGIVTAGQRLLCLPTYRPLLALMSAEVTAQLIDGTQAELLPTDTAGIPGIKADFGRLVVRTVGRAGTQIRLQCGTRSGLVTFVDARSALAVEVTPVHLPGTDPEEEPGSRWIVADLYATGGDVLWTEGDAPPVAIPANSWMMLSGEMQQQPVPVKELPEWLATDSAASLENGADRLASTNLERELQGERAQRFGASLVLLELNEHQRRENRWLAARCLAYIGNFHALAEPLADPDFPPVWTSQAIEFLRESVDRSPESASRVREALEKAHGQDAARLFRVFWGFSEDQLKAGEGLRLVADLESESLAVRILSFAYLRDYFGLTLSYDPTEREAVRRVRAQRWRDSLESGELWTKRASAQPDALPLGPPPPPTE